MPPTAATSLGLVESSALLRSGSRRRSVIAVNSTLCDLYVLGGDRLLHIYNPKAAGALRCTKRVRPQLLDDSFLRRWPGFWQMAPHEQADVVAQAYDASANLDLPHEVVDVCLHEASGLLALVGTHRVSVMLLPRLESMGASAHARDDLAVMLDELGLGEYGPALRERGYDHVPTLLRMGADEREAMTRAAEMLPGHAQTLLMHLDGRLPPAPKPAGASHHDRFEASPCWALPVPLRLPWAAADAAGLLPPGSTGTASAAALSAMSPLTGAAANAPTQARRRPGASSAAASLRRCPSRVAAEAASAPRPRRRSSTRRHARPSRAPRAAAARRLRVGATWASTLLTVSTAADAAAAAGAGRRCHAVPAGRSR